MTFDEQTALPTRMTAVRQSVRRWLAAPVFPDDEVKTHQASVLNFVLLVSIVTILLLTLLDLVIAYPSPVLIGVELSCVAALVASRQIAQRGQVQAAGIFALTLGLVGLTLANVIFGTVRGPSAAGYLLLIVISSLLLGTRGLVLTMIASGLCVVGLLGAEAAGWISPIVRSAEGVEWLNFLIWIAGAAGISYWGLRVTRAALRRAEQELAARRVAEAALLVAKDQAEAANRAKSKFLANMSHELRTPLNAILGFSELMTRDPYLTHVQQENLAIINRSGEHLLSLINDILDMAKIEAGRVTLQARDFDLHYMLLNLMEIFRARVEAKHLTFVLTQWPDVPRFIHADQRKLRQVLLNLLGNAVKFTDAGGIELAVARVGDRLRFAVEDTGPGIAPGDLGAIFEPFVQTGSGGMASNGTGLGLPISREFARLMGGDLTVSSALRVGSIFQLEIPLHLPQNGPPILPPTEARRVSGLAPGQGEVRLLVVDDDFNNRKLLADLLAALGFAVRTATNGAEAISVWEVWQPHLIWMDIHMPVMDGYAAARRIKTTAQGQQTVIVAVSASIRNEEHTDSCDDFVSKPFREEEIVAQLAKHLEVHFTHARSLVDISPACAEDALTWPANVELPEHWLVCVRQAALAADAVALLRLAAEVDRAAPTVARSLHGWVDAFDYGAVLRAVSGVSDRSKVMS